MKEKHLGTFFSVILIIASVIYFAPKIYRSHVKLVNFDKEENRLKDKIDNISEKISILDNEIKKLNEDFQREKVARNRLQMVKENEEIYRFIKGKQEDL